MGKGVWCFTAVATLVLAAAIILLIWLSSSPKDPHLFVDKASISGNNFTADDHLNSTFQIHVTAYNPNAHYFIYYDVVMVSVYDNGTLLAYEVLPDPFTQKPKAQLSLKLGLLAHNVSMADGPGPSNSTAVVDLKTAGMENLEVRVRAVTRFVFKRWKKFHHVMKAVCWPVTVKFNSSSEASGAQKTRCYVNVY